MEYFEDYYVKAKGLLQSNPSEAYNLLLKCDKMDPNDIGVNNYLFYLEMITGNYDKAVKRLDLLFTSENDTYVRNLNIYLVLLNKIYELPDNYKAYVANLKISDVQIDNPYELKRLENENRVRNLIMINRNYNALKVLDTTIRVKNYISLSDNIIKILLNKVVLEENINNQILVSNIKRKNYQKAIEVLEKMKAKDGLRRSRVYCLRLLYILNSGVVPPIIKQDKEYVDFTDFIDNNDFRKALAYRKDSLMEQDKMVLQNRPMYLLLKDVVELLDREDGITLNRGL